MNNNWYRFWRPESGLVGGLIMGTLISASLYGLFVTWFE